MTHYLFVVIIMLLYLLMSTAVSPLGAALTAKATPALWMRRRMRAGLSGLRAGPAGSAPGVLGTLPRWVGIAAAAFPDRHGKSPAGPRPAPTQTGSDINRQKFWVVYQFEILGSYESSPRLARNAVSTLKRTLAGNGPKFRLIRSRRSIERRCPHSIIESWSSGPRWSAPCTSTCMV